MDIGNPRRDALLLTWHASLISRWELSSEANRNSSNILGVFKKSWCISYLRSVETLKPATQGVRSLLSGHNMSAVAAQDLSYLPYKDLDLQARRGNQLSKRNIDRGVAHTEDKVKATMSRHFLEEDFLDWIEKLVRKPQISQRGTGQPEPSLLLEESKFCLEISHESETTEAKNISCVSFLKTLNQTDFQVAAAEHISTSGEARNSSCQRHPKSLLES
ncbi:hypothetical protein RRG08_008077 [Elysia crispata]|uniref:Uncharacterized protein n=1 Tax=Elysia crispata TaxID=231223 RepID=A0AAE0Y001_9GAST|nr:hypothetical protein RRG08_008077 [Elysia crispata]